MNTLKIALVFALIGVVLAAEIKGIQEAKQKKEKELAATSKEIKKEEDEVDSNDLDVGTKKEISTKSAKEVKTEKKTEVNEDVKTTQKGKEDNKVRLEIPVEEVIKDKDFDIEQKRLKRQLDLGSNILNPLGSLNNVTRILGQIFG